MIAITASISDSEKPPFLWLDAVDFLVIGVPPSPPRRARQVPRSDDARLRLQTPAAHALGATMTTS
jgi:hypothetical protein